jgi:c-di-GMP-binding flagellar brake protein YcgR
VSIRNLAQSIAADAGDRRTGPRRICQIRAEIALPDRRVIAALSSDISREGIALLLPYPLPVGTMCSIGFSLFIRGGLQRVDVEAKALNSVFLSHDVRVGFSFTRVSPDHQRVLSDFIGFGTGR